MKLKIVTVFLLLSGRCNGEKHGGKFKNQINEPVSNYESESDDDRHAVTVHQDDEDNEEHGQDLGDRFDIDGETEDTSAESEESISTEYIDTSGPEVTSSDYSNEERHKLSMKPQNLKVEPKSKSLLKGEVKKYLAEVKHGDMADFLGSNSHLYEPMMYEDLSRRFVPQYPYIEIPKKQTEKKSLGNDIIVPEKASPELVLEVAKKSVLLNSMERPKRNDKAIQKKLLRSGDYWNSVWVEEVQPKSLRTYTKQREPEPLKKIGNNPLKLKLSPESRYYKLIQFLHNVSPRLVYIVNKAHR